MSKQKLHSDSVVGMRYRGNRTSLCNGKSRDSEGERYGARDSLQASPQDDRVGGGRGDGLPASHRGPAYDESPKHASSKNGVSIEKRYRGSNLSSQPNKQAMGQDKFSDDDTRSAPPVAGSLQPQNRVSEKLQTLIAADALPHSSASGGSEAEIEANKSKSSMLGAAEVENSGVSTRNRAVSSRSVAGRYPTFHASGLGNWYAVLSYDASVRLCLHLLERGCKEASSFLENGCALLRDAFGLRNVLLQSEEELMRKDPSELVGEGAYVKTKKTIGKIEVQVRKVKMGMDQPTVPHIVVGTRSRRYLKQVLQLIKIGFNALVQEPYSCLLRLKSSSEEDALRMQPGSGETHSFLPDGLGDDLIIEVQDSKGKYCGHPLVKLADIAGELGKSFVIVSCLGNQSTNK